MANFNLSAWADLAKGLRNYGMTHGESYTPVTVLDIGRACRAFHKASDSGKAAYIRGVNTRIANNKYYADRELAEAERENDWLCSLETRLVASGSQVGPFVLARGQAQSRVPLFFWRETEINADWTPKLSQATQYATRALGESKIQRIKQVFGLAPMQLYSFEILDKNYRKAK
jgi:hypothetical protein